MVLHCSDWKGLWVHTYLRGRTRGAKQILRPGVLNSSMPTAAIPMWGGNVVQSCGEC